MIGDLKPLEEVLKDPLEDVIKRLQQLPTSDNTVNNNKTKTLTDNDIEDLITNLNKKPSTQIHTNITVPTDEELDDYINKLKI